MFLCVCLFPRLNFRKSLLQSLLLAHARRTVIFPPQKGVRQTLHVRQLLLRIVGVLVTLSVIQIAHKPRHAVSDHEGHRLRQIFDRILLRLVVGHLHGVGLGRLAT